MQNCCVLSHLFSACLTQSAAVTLNMFNVPYTFCVVLSTALSLAIVTLVTPTPVKLSLLQRVISDSGFSPGQVDEGCVTPLLIEIRLT